MACFHSRYNLGDKIDAKTPEEFWNNLVCKYCSDEEIINALIDMNLEESCVVIDNDNSSIEETRYAICCREDQANPWYTNLKYNEIATYARGDFSIRDCQILLDKYIAWLPLWLHDHSGLSMDCDTRFRDLWDDGKVGWIVTAISDGSDNTKMKQSESCVMKLRFTAIIFLVKTTAIHFIEKNTESGKKSIGHLDLSVLMCLKMVLYTALDVVSKQH